MTSEVLDTIRKFLEEKGVEFKEYRHAPVRTSEEAARVRGTGLSQGAKALVMVADGKFVMLVVPGDRKVDFRKFKRLFNISDLRMATKEEGKQVTGVEVGAVPPLGNIFNLATYFDEELKREERLVFNAGRHEVSMELDGKDLAKAVKPVWEKFSTERGA